MPDTAPSATILIAEDDDTQRTLYADLLAQAGYRVLEASDGVQSLEIARTQRPHLVLVDVAMPGMSGWNLVRELRDDYTLGALRVIVVSGLVDSWDRDASIAAGADSHLAKPVDPHQLLAEIKRVLKR
jgi:CheY-like chemotaxis protein